MEERAEGSGSTKGMNLCYMDESETKWLCWLKSDR